MKKLVLFCFSIGMTFGLEPTLAFIGTNKKLKTKHRSQPIANASETSRPQTAFAKNKTISEEKLAKIGQRTKSKKATSSDAKKEGYLNSATIEYEFLFAQVTSPGPILAFQSVLSGFTINAGPLRLRYGVRPGHRATITFGCPKQHLQLQGSMFRGKRSKAATTQDPNTSFLPGFNAISSLVRFPASTTNGSMRYRNYNGELSVGRYFIMKPRFAMKGFAGGDFLYFKNQDAAFYFSPEDETDARSLDIQSKTKVIGGGLVAGLYSKYFIVKDFFLFSEFKGQLLIGHNSFRQQFLSGVVGQQLITTNYRESFWDIKPGTHLKLGLGFDRCLSKSVSLGLSTAYELLYRFNMLNRQEINPLSFVPQGEDVTRPIAVASTVPFAMWAISIGIKLGF